MLTPNHPEHETDPRFPSGPWRGFWLQRRTRGWMNLQLVFKDGDVRGEGEDIVGKFVIRGNYCVETDKVTFRKHYVNGHMVAYAGVAGLDSQIRGQWEIRACEDNGYWRIWPVQMCEACRRSTAAARDQPVVVEDWKDYQLWFEEVLE